MYRKNALFAEGPHKNRRSVALKDPLPQTHVVARKHCCKFVQAQF